MRTLKTSLLPSLIAGALLFLSTPVTAQRADCPNQPRPQHAPRPQCQPGATANPPALRPTRTADGVPIRYVNVPIPNYARFGTPYGNQFGGGYNAYYYQQIYGGGGGSQGYTAAPPTQPVRRKAEPAKPDPRTRATHQFRKAYSKFVKENSLGGKLYLKQGKKRWIVRSAGKPVISGHVAEIPVYARLKSKGLERPYLLKLNFTDSNKSVVTSASLVPQDKV